MKKKLNVSHADVINAMFKKIKIGLTKYKYNQKITHLDHLDTGILIVRPIFKLKIEYIPLKGISTKLI